MLRKLEFDVGKNFNGGNLKNMSLVSSVIDPSELLDKKIVGARRIPMDDFPIFTKKDPIELLESYIVDCLAISVTPVAYSYEELPYHPHDMYSLKRKMKYKSSGDGPSGTAKPPHQGC